jgi:hypothetical protein
MSTPDDDSLEQRLRALVEEIQASLERAVDQIDLSELNERVDELRDPIERAVERFDLDDLGERLDGNARELAELAMSWLGRQFGTSTSPWAPETGQGLAPTAPGRRGPHPLDVPTEAQGLALSALESGRWRVDPGSDELIQVGGGPNPEQPVGLVGELRARDWVSASGHVTLVGRDALGRWLGRPDPN